MLHRDLAYALRGLRRRPGFTLAAALSLALGIGATTALFTLVDAALNRPLPFADPDRLVVLWEQHTGQGRDREGASPGNVFDWRAGSAAFDGLAAYYVRNALLSEPHEAEVVIGAQVTADFFRTLGTEPRLGRTFTSQEFEEGVNDASQRPVSGDAVVISHRLWQRRFGGDLAVVGRSLTVDGRDRRVVGVMPPSFAALEPEVEVWLPWDMARGYARLGGPPRDWRFLRTVARLRAGTSLEAAQAEIDVVAAAIARAHPDTNDGWGVRVVPLHDEIVGSSRPLMLALFGAVLLILLLTSVNVANLQIARAAGRRQEVAVRRALGATRGDLVRQLLVDSLCLTALGGAIGVFLAAALLEYLVALAPPAVVALDRLAIDARVLSFATVLTLVTGLLSGLLPALRGSDIGVADALRSGSRGGDRALRLGLRRALVIAQVSAALVLLAAAGVLVRSLVELRKVDPGFRTDNLLVLDVSLNATAYAAGARRIDYFDRLTARLAEIPGVERVSATTVMPMSGGGTDFSRPYWRADRARPSGSPPVVDIRMVLPGYARAMGIRLLAGRDIDPRDRADTPRVVLINERLARTAWAGEDPIGKQIVLDYQRGPYPYEIVGVVNDTRYYGLRSAARPEVFIPYKQNPYPGLSVVARTAAAPATLMAAARQALREVDPAQPAQGMTTMAALIGGTLDRERLATWLLGAMGLLALILAAVGIWGVIEFAVSQRTREIGIRIAFGAHPRRIMRAVLGEALVMVAAGLGIGLVLAWGLAGAIGSLLFNVSPLDPLTVAATASLLVAVATLAAYVPSRRAMRVDPAVAMRAE